MEPIRVSTVLKLLFPGSLDFVEQHQLDRGTRLHEAMEIWGNNQIHGYQGEVMPEIRPMVDWLEKEAVVVESCEEWVEHPLGFGGHPDCLATWRGKPYWIDWKFAETISEQNQVQGNAYTHLLKRPGLFLQCNGAGIVRAVRCKRDPYLLAAFLSGLNVVKFQRAHRPERLTESQLADMAKQLLEVMTNE